MAKVSNLTLKVQGQNLDIVYAKWSFSGSNLDYYRVRWYYYTSGVSSAFSGGENKVNGYTDTYSPPSNTRKVKVIVTPVAKKHKVNGKEVYYWNGESVSATYELANNPPEQPNAPEVTIEGYKLTAIANTTDSRADKMQFYVINGNSKFTQSDPITVKNQRATFVCTIKAGGTYRVRCRAINETSSGSVYSQWSEYSGDTLTIPAEMGSVKISVESKTSVKLSWSAVKNAKSYTIEYTTNPSYFDSSSEVSSASSETKYAYISGLESGNKYYFRVRAVNDQGETGWSEIVSTVLGTDPIAPTTWSSTTTAMVGEKVTLYWMHNCEDGSKQKEAQIELTIKTATTASTTTKTVTFDTEDDNDDNDMNGSYVLDLTSHPSGAEVLWRVRTKGITDVYGEWSVQRTINIYAPVTLSVNFVDDTELVQTFPCKLVATAGPDTQKAINFHVSIKATQMYEVRNESGTWFIVNKGDVIFSKVYNATSNVLSTYISAGDVTLKNNQTYQLIVTVAMDSGLVGESTEIFEVSWGDDVYEPDAEIYIDDSSYSVCIFPFCRDTSGILVSDVVLSVYRRNYDGSLTLIEDDLNNDGSVGVLDMHPALDYARYRVVARNKNTSVVGYQDLPGYPVNKPYIVIQWDESYSEFNRSETEDELEIAPYSASQLILPYNIGFNESNDKDMSLIKYIGRRNPVSYYGTQIGETATLNTEIPEEDEDTLYALRRLSAWMGDCYVRYPTGVGYWAQVSVSFNRTDGSLTIPITLTVKHVEGGA